HIGGGRKRVGLWIVDLRARDRLLLVADSARDQHLAGKRASREQSRGMLAARRDHARALEELAAVKVKDALHLAGGREPAGCRIVKLGRVERDLLVPRLARARVAFGR